MTLNKEELNIVEEALNVYSKYKQINADEIFSKIVDIDIAAWKYNELCK